MARTKTVLLVDDDPDSRAIYRILLDRAGYDVLEAEDGGDAFLLARSETPDLIVMNLSMPTINGFDATEMLKSDSETAPIPVLILTGHNTPAIDDLAWKAGCDDLLRKPLSPSELEAEIRRRIGPPIAAST